MAENEITIEKRKAITIIAAAAIIASAMGIGLAKVGTGFASRSSDGITVTGSAKVSAISDNAVWTLSVQAIANDAASAVNKIGGNVDTVTAYLKKGGVTDDQLTLGPVNSYPTEEYISGNPTGRILNYRANRDVTVRTEDVQLVSKLSQNLGTVLKSGVNVSNYGPQYYISTLPKLRPQLLKNAMKDAKVRAEAMTSAVGGKVGSITSIKAGPIQVTAKDSTMTSDIGAYETQTIDKTVTATVTVTFNN